VLAALALGGVAARRTRDKLSRSFARGLATVVTLFNPEVVVLGNGLWRDLWPAVRDDVEPWLSRLVMPALRDGVDVRLSGLGDDSTILGAAEMAFESLLDDPLRAFPAATLTT
jgi:predicted NBD/HSP70 family sugar kinase